MLVLEILEMTMMIRKIENLIKTKKKVHFLKFCDSSSHFWSCFDDFLSVMVYCLAIFWGEGSGVIKYVNGLVINFQVVKLVDVDTYLENVY